MTGIVNKGYFRIRIHMHGLNFKNRFFSNAFIT